MSAPLHVSAALLRSWPLPAPPADGDKESRGSVVVAGGSACMPGAVLLTAEACLRSGAGKVQVFTAQEALPLAAHLPEAWVGLLGAGCAEHEHLERCSALAIGPGLADAEDGTQAVAWLAPYVGRIPTVLDAHALAAARTAARAGATLVLTPHAGEMAMLSGWTKQEVQERPREAAQALAAELPAVVMLKGPTTWIAAPDGSTWASSAGGIGLGTAGSGDVLAGICAGLLAQGATAVQAAVWAAHLHGLCGDHLARTVGQVGFLARELLPLIPLIRARLSPSPIRSHARLLH